VIIFCRNYSATSENVPNHKVPKDVFRNAQIKKIEKGPNNAELGLIVTTGEIQTQSQTDHVKAVARGTHPRCGRTLV